MHPLVYTAPVRKSEYLGGRFLAAFALNALILLGVPVGVMLAVYLPGVDPEVVGPFRPAAYLSAYGFIALPTAFIGTAIQFLWAALGRRSIASYLGSVLLFFAAYGGMVILGIFVGREDLAAFLDVFGHVYITSDLILGWTPMEKNTRLIALEGTLLWSRVVWVGVAAGALTLTYLRFRFAHHAVGRSWLRAPGRRGEDAPTPSGSDLARRAISLPAVRQTFGPAIRARQTLAVARESFGTIARRRGGLLVPLTVGALAVPILSEKMQSMGNPLVPRTEFVLTFLTAALTDPLTPWVIIPLLTILWAGELAWWERDAGLGEIADAAPLPEWVPFLGKLLGLGAVLAVWMAVLAAVGMVVQLRLGHHDVEPGIYLQVLFGLQLPQYLLFATLALVVHGLVGQKHTGHLAALLAYAFILFAGRLGVEHNLLVYGSTPRWAYSDLRGFGGTLGPWRWFMLYWGAWALLLAVGARLFWVRGMEPGPGARLRDARARLTRATVWTAAAGAGLALGVGGFIFYNTNVLNAYRSGSEVLEARAEYERRYARFAHVPQPRLTGTRLHVELYPERRAMEIRGTHRLVNRSETAIDSIHLATPPGLAMGAVSFDRAATRVLADRTHGHHVYALGEPLRPGDSLALHFAVHHEPRGFDNQGVDPVMGVTASSTFFRNLDALPAIGYQLRREILKPAERREHGLPARPLIPHLTATGGGQDITGDESGHVGSDGGVVVETVVGTALDQTAVAPGTLRRSWTEEGRRYFHYATEAPIGNEYRLFSARYAVRRETWKEPATGREIAIEIYHHPRHTALLDHMLSSVRASLAHYSRALGPYRYDHVRLVENPGPGVGMHADAATIDYTAGFSRYKPLNDPQGLDFPFAVVAHEMAHQWHPPIAFVEGAPLLTESFAWYAAMGVVEETYGREHVRRLLRSFREPHPIPPIRQSVPLLRAADPYASYRKGPFALYALSRYAGAERVNLAYRRLLEKHRADGVPAATALDFYRELQATTPDSLRPLLHDLFAANTFWELKTERATATRTAAGPWQVTLRIRARKVTVDPAGVETEVPMDERVQVGVFEPTGQGAEFGETLYLGMHRIRSGEQTIEVTVPREPADAGIDPYHLLIDLERFDNVEKVEAES